MLFNSYVFIFAFLPVALAGYALVTRTAPRPFALAWLVLCSLFYYGWWNPNYLPLLAFSMLFNFAVGASLSARPPGRYKQSLLTLGVATNLALIGYYKYAAFIAATVGTLTGHPWSSTEIILPLAISFFTFQQIAYLVDAYRGLVREYNFIDYCLFVTFFPQLIAGPIVHHSEMLPQFKRDQTAHPQARNFAIGLSIFTIGLFKKVILADTAATFATPVFDAADAASAITFADAWLATLAFTLQLYFDFSGYSDMAIGIARLFGIRLPLNFNSPYKATSVDDFWRRWHITLSRFLRDYLYIPLGGNRRGKPRRYLNLMITMLLGGLWHGAGWTFVIWGALHGLYLCINHGWAAIRRHFNVRPVSETRLGAPLAVLLTFLAVTVAWVFFRASSLAAATRLFAAMAGAAPADARPILDLPQVTPWIAVLLTIVWLLPNTQQIMAAYRPALREEDRYRPRRAQQPILPVKWQPTWHWALGLACVAVVTIAMMSKYSEFIYYDF